MPWVRLDDSHHDDPRVLAVSLAAVGLLHIGLIWASRHLTDGWVSEQMLRSRAGRSIEKLTAALERVNLMTRSEREGIPGWRIADDLVALQPTREQVERQRAAARDRQQRHRGSQPDENVTDNRLTPESRRDINVTDAVVTLLSHDPDPTRPDPKKDRDQEQRAGARHSHANERGKKPRALHEIRMHLEAAVWAMLRSGSV
jgi:hypothetical protein